MKKVTSLLLLTGVAAFGLVGCGDDVVTQPDDPQVLSVTVTPSSVSIEEGETVTLSANVEADEDADKSVTWSSSNSSVASVDGSGNVTGQSTGSATILATSNADASKSGAAEVTVTQEGGERPTVSILGIDCDESIADCNEPDNIEGDITVTVNVDEGDQDLSAVQLLLNGDVVREQTFSTNVSGIATATEGTSNITWEIKTDGADECTIGQQLTPNFPNGKYELQARLLLEAGDPETATWDDSLNFNNDNEIRIVHIEGTGNDVVGNGERYWSEAYDVAADVDANGDGVLDRELQFAACPVVFDETDVAEIAIDGETTSDTFNGDDLKDLSVALATEDDSGDHGVKVNDAAEPWQYAAPAAVNDSVEDDPGSGGHVIGDDFMVMDSDGVDVTDEFTVVALSDFHLDFTAPMDDPNDENDPRIQIDAMDIFNGVNPRHYGDDLATELPDGTFLGDPNVTEPVGDYSVAGLMDGGVGHDPSAQPVDVYHDTADVNNGMPLAQDLESLNDLEDADCVVPDTITGDDFCLQEEGPATSPLWYVSQTPRIFDLLGNTDTISTMTAAEATDNNFTLLRRSDEYGIDRTAPTIVSMDTIPEFKVIDDTVPFIIFNADDPNLNNGQGEDGSGVDNTGCATECTAISAYDSDAEEFVVDDNTTPKDDATPSTKDYRINFGTTLDNNEGDTVTVDAFVPDSAVKSPNVQTLSWTFIFDTLAPTVGFSGVSGLNSSDADEVTFTVEGTVIDRNGDGTAVTEATIFVTISDDNMCNDDDDAHPSMTTTGGLGPAPVSPDTVSVLDQVQANGGAYTQEFLAQNTDNVNETIVYCFNMQADDGAMSTDGTIMTPHQKIKSASKTFTWNP